MASGKKKTHKVNSEKEQNNWKQENFFVQSSPVNLIPSEIMKQIVGKILKQYSEQERAEKQANGSIPGRKKLLD